MANEDLYEMYKRLLRAPQSNDLVFKGADSFLSNMYPTQIQIGNALYNSAEGAFQAGKLRMPGVDKNVIREMLPKFTAANGYEARRLGRYGLRMTPEQLNAWNGGEDDFMNPNAGKFGRMFQVLSSKFSDPELASRLKDTGAMYLREGTNIEPWGGDSNVLGRMLMLIRDMDK